MEHGQPARLGLIAASVPVIRQGRPRRDTHLSHAATSLLFDSCLSTGHLRQATRFLWRRRPRLHRTKTGDCPTMRIYSMDFRDRTAACCAAKREPVYRARFSIARRDNAPPRAISPIIPINGSVLPVAGSVSAAGIGVVVTATSSAGGAVTTAASCTC